MSRLGPDRYFLTTTTGNADAIESWFRWNLAGRPDWDVTLANVSGSYAAMNLAGPKSRDILKKLTTADVSQKGLPYLAVGQFDIAGIPAIVFRIGFVGNSATRSTSRPSTDCTSGRRSTKRAAVRPEAVRRRSPAAAAARQEAHPRRASTPTPCRTRSRPSSPGR